MSFLNHPNFSSGIFPPGFTSYEIGNVMLELEGKAKKLAAALSKAHLSATDAENLRLPGTCFITEEQQTKRELSFCFQHMIMEWLHSNVWGRDESKLSATSAFFPSIDRCAMIQPRDLYL